MMRIRMGATYLLFIVLFGAHAHEAATPSPNPAGQPAQAAQEQISPYAQNREAALVPALQVLEHKDYEQALTLLHAVLEKYPNDGRVLLLAGNAARLSKHYDEALADYQKSISQPHRGMQAEFGLIQTYAALGRWDDFDKERQKVRAARENNDPSLARMNEYVIDKFTVGDKEVTAVEFPDLAGRFHTRYRFFINAGKPAPDGADANWTPYIDLESDDIDQVEFAKKHPERAAAGERSFSLDGYFRPRTHATLQFYPDGEPSYREARTDVVASLNGNLNPMSTVTAH